MQQDQLDAERPLNRADSEKRAEAQSDLQQQDRQELDRNQLEQQLAGPHQRSQQQAFRFILTQLLTTIILSVLLLFFDPVFDYAMPYVVAYSSLTGGLIATLANAWFALKVFRVKPTVAAETLLTTFYVGEIYKFVFTGAMFVIAFVLIKPISIVALLLTYLLIHMTPVVQNVFTKH
jgi:ATP synthase protein I